MNLKINAKKFLNLFQTYSKENMIMEQVTGIRATHFLLTRQLHLDIENCDQNYTFATCPDSLPHLDPQNN